MQFTTAFVLLAATLATAMPAPVAQVEQVERGSVQYYTGVSAYILPGKVDMP